MGDGGERRLDEARVGDEASALRGAEGAVDLGGAGGVEDEAGVGGGDAGAGHDDEAAIGLTDELAEQGDAGFGSGGLAGGEEARAAQGDDGLEGAEGGAAMVEGAVEGDLHALGGFDEAAAEGEVDVAVGRQGSDDYAIGAQLAGKADVAEHDFGFGIVIDEVAFAGTDEDVQLEAFDATGGLDHAGRGGEAVEGEGSAQLDALRAATGGCLRAGQVACTYFEDSHSTKGRGRPR